MHTSHVKRNKIIQKTFSRENKQIINCNISNRAPIFLILILSFDCVLLKL